MYRISIISESIPDFFRDTEAEALAVARERAGTEPIREADGSWWAEGALVDRGPNLSLGKRSSVRVREVTR